MSNFPPQGPSYSGPVQSPKKGWSLARTLLCAALALTAVVVAAGAWFATRRSDTSRLANTSTAAPVQRNPCDGRSATDLGIENVPLEPVTLGGASFGYAGQVDARLCLTTEDKLQWVTGVRPPDQSDGQVVYAAVRFDAENGVLPTQIHEASTWTVNNLPPGREATGLPRDNFAVGGSRFVIGQQLLVQPRIGDDIACQTFGAGAYVAFDPTVADQRVGGWFATTGPAETAGELPGSIAAQVVVDGTGEASLSSGGTRPDCNRPARSLEPISLVRAAPSGLGR